MPATAPMRAGARRTAQERSADRMRPNPGAASRIEPARIAAAIGRTDLVALIGRDVLLKRRGREWFGLCPFHNERTPSFTVNPEKEFYHCFGCGAHGTAIGYLMRAKGLEFPAALAELEGTAAPAPVVRSRMGGLAGASGAITGARRAEMEAQDRAGRRCAAGRIWEESVPLAPGDPAWRWLAGRGIDVSAAVSDGRWSGALRVHAGLRHRDGTSHPAMVAMIAAPDGSMAAVHRTFLGESDGRVVKAAVEDPRLTLGEARGGAIRLFSMVDRDGVWSDALGLAEGIEDALAAWLLGGGLIPVWSCIDAGKLAAVELPFDASDITIYADADAPKPERDMPEGVGLFFARRLQARLRAEARRVRIVVPESGAKDFNDELVAWRAGRGGRR